MVVFRPFRGEILYGRIKSSIHEGIVIDLDFHNEIFVPYQNLFENSDFDQNESTWIWRPEGGTELFFDKGEPVLFRVEQEEWFDQKPSVQQKDEQGNPVDTRGTAWRVIVSIAVSSLKSHADKLQGSMNQSGLGPTLWWEEAGEEEGEEGGDGDVDMDGLEE